MRSSKLDLLKGLAIIGVALYHAGYMQYGYLGVEIFLVIAGYLTAKGISRRILEKRFTPLGFMWERIARLLPLVLVAGAVSMAFGAFLMLPDDFENLCDSVIASSFFANNILQWITSRNYWAAINEVKPLMHFWYLGLLVQFYVLFIAVVAFLAKLCPKRAITVLRLIVSVLLVASLMLYVSPIGDVGQHFYFLPWRLFEFLAGVMIALLSTRRPKVAEGAEKKMRGKLIASRSLYVEICLAAIVALCLSSWIDLPNQLRTVLMAMVACVVVVIPDDMFLFLSGRVFAPIIWCGKASLSIYVWHQVILAFTRYSFETSFSMGTLAVMMAILICLSFAGYFFIEQKFTRLGGWGTIALGVAFIALNGLAFVGYTRAGVVRDIPELDVYVANAQRGIHAEYNERVMQYNNPFKAAGKKKVLVIGDSFARDWSNVLLESDVADKIELSYFRQVDPPADVSDRVRNADAVFYTTSGDFFEFPEYLSATTLSDKLFVVGTKYFGNSNGQVYARRYEKDYFNATVEIPLEYLVRNERQQNEYGDHFVDMIAALQVKPGVMPIFSDENKYISQDCRHFTRGGAKYAAKRIDLAKLLGVTD